MGELNIYGVYVPILLLQAIFAYVLLRVAMRGLDILLRKGWIAWPNLFYLCIYVLILGAVHWLYLVL